MFNFYSLINSSNLLRFVTSSGSLIIENVGSSDEGSYQCAVHVTDEKNFVWTYLSRRAAIRLPFLSRFYAFFKNKIDNMTFLFKRLMITRL